MAEKNMTDTDLQISAMYQLEMACDLMGNASQRLEMDGVDAYVIASASFTEALDRAVAGLYMVQAMQGGNKPPNYQEMLDRANKHDAVAETHDLMARMQRGHQMGGH